MTRLISSTRHRRDLIVSAQQGFSLVELMIALALSTFLLGGLILTYTSGRTAALDAENLSRVQENMRFLSDHLLRDVRNAGFRDQGSLFLSQANQIAGEYARIVGVNADRLEIQYAGRSHCAQARDPLVNLADELKVIRNEYFVQNGSLRCRGTANGAAPNTIDLVTGISSVEFAFIRPAGAPVSTSCTYESDTDLETACTGVEITLRFIGVGPGDVMEATLSASFRNVLLERIFGRPS